MNDSDRLRLEELLNSLPAEELVSLLGRRRYSDLYSLVTRKASEEFSDEEVARYAVALDGPDLLEKPGLLSALLLQSGTRNVRKLAKTYLDRPLEHDADNAISLTAKPLRSNSSLTRDILQALGLSEFMLPDMARKPTVETIEPFEPLPPIFDYQQEVRSRCLELLTGNTRELLIQMPTGAGKTRTAMELVVDLVEYDQLFEKGMSIVWLAHTEELCEQAVESFSSVWATRGTKSTNVVRLWGTYTPASAQLSGALIVAGTTRVHSLRRSDKKAFEALTGKSAIIVIDEAHRALAPTVMTQISYLRGVTEKLLIGLSATPARSSEAEAENVKLAALFGHNLVTPNLGEDPIQELRRRGILAELDRIELAYGDKEDEIESTDVVEDTDEDFPETVLTSLATNTARNSAIIRELENRVSSSEPAIVFCCSVAHATLLAAALRLRGVRAASVDCRMRRGTRRSVIQQFSIGEIDVLLNFGVLSTGFDAPNVRTVVIARPTKSMILYSQMLGRGLRGPKMGGTVRCTLIDVRDHLGRFGDLSSLYLRFKPYWERGKGS